MSLIAMVLTFCIAVCHTMSLPTICVLNDTVLGKQSWMPLVVCCGIINDKQHVQQLRHNMKAVCWVC